MKFRSLYAMTALGLCACTLATAAQPAGSPVNESGFYLGVLGSRIDYKEDGFDSLHPSAVGLMGGWRVNRYFGFEARLGGGVSSDSFQVAGPPGGPGPIQVDLKLRSYFSALLRGTLPVSDLFNVYAVAGQTRADFSANASGFTVTGSDSSFSYAIGVEWMMGASHSAIGVEGGRFLSGSGYNANAISISFRHHF